MSNRRKIKSPRMTATLDQLQSAQRDSDKIVGAARASMLADRDGSESLIGGFTDLAVDRRIRQWKRSPWLAACDHLASPKPLVGLLHRPGEIFCTRCGVEELRRDADQRPETCDGCGRDSMTFHPSMISTGWVLTIWGSICAACKGESAQMITETLAKINPGTT